MATYMSTVFNDDTEVYTETLRGETYTIPGKGSIRLSRRKAVQLVGSYLEPIKDGGGAPLNCKKLRVVHDAIGDSQGSYVSHITGEEFSSKDELMDHLKKHEHKVFKDERLEKKGKEEETTKAPVYVCPLCDYESPTKAGVKSHMRGKHKDDTADTTGQREGAGS